MINKIILALTAGMLLFAGAVTMAKSAERKCNFSVSEQLDENRSATAQTDFKSRLLTVQERDTLIENLGRPPVDDPFSITMLGAEIDGQNAVQFYVHDGDCGLLMSKVFPADILRVIFGARNAAS